MVNVEATKYYQLVIENHGSNHLNKTKQISSLP